MSDNRYSTHLARAVPLKQLVRSQHHQRVIDACLLHRFGNLPGKTRLGHMTFLLTGDPTEGWYLSIYDRQLGYQEYDVLEDETSFLVRGGGLSTKSSQFSKSTLTKLEMV